MNEAALNATWLQCDLTDERAQAFARDVLNHMRERLVIYQEKYGDLYNLEATPAESTSYRLAKHDKAQYPDIITANEGGTPYYTNSSHLPVGYTEDIFSALDVQDELQTLYTSGTVFHAFLGEKLPDWKAAARLVRTIAENYRLPYYTLSPTYSVCKDHGYLAGEQWTCPECGKETEVYSRITGYYRPVKNWNDGKAQEYKDRKVYDVEHSHMDVAAREAAGCRCGYAGEHAEEAQGRSDGLKNVGFIPEDAAAIVNERAAHAVQKDGVLPAGAYLITTETCPNCKRVKPLLAQAGVEYTELLASQNEELVAKLGVMTAPTLLVVDDGGAQQFYVGAPAIMQMLATAKA